jgi:Winged helix-turn-helix domain (DUF2582)
MEEKIGTLAGAIWNVLNTKGAMSLAQLKIEVDQKTPLFDWSVGWLAREDRLLITPEKRSFRIQLKDTQTKAAGTA